MTQAAHPANNRKSRKRTDILRIVFTCASPESGKKPSELSRVKANSAILVPAQITCDKSIPCDVAAGAWARQCKKFRHCAQDRWLDE
jgi:hypothetical protein